MKPARVDPIAPQSPSGAPEKKSVPWEVIVALVVLSSALGGVREWVDGQADWYAALWSWMPAHAFVGALAAFIGSLAGFFNGRDWPTFHWVTFSIGVVWLISLDLGLFLYLGFVLVTQSGPLATVGVFLIGAILLLLVLAGLFLLFGG